jgi:hypothetical protein
MAIWYAFFRFGLFYQVKSGTPAPGTKRKNATSDVGDNAGNDNAGSAQRGGIGRRGRGRDDDGSDEGNGDRAVSRKREKPEMAPPAFCSASVVNMTCKPQFPGTDPKASLEIP